MQFWAYGLVRTDTGLIRTRTYQYGLGRRSTDALSPFYTFPDLMPDDAGCRIFVVWGDPASLISNAGVNTGLFTVVTRTMTVSILMNTVSTRTSPERLRSMPAWSRSVQSLPVLTRLILGRTRMSTNKQDLSLLRRYPWSSVTGRDQSVYNPYTSMLVHRKYSYTDGPGLYTVTLVATRYLPVYSRNQHGWFSSGTIREKN
jgi:hypothetical protein